MSISSMVDLGGEARVEMRGILRYFPSSSSGKDTDSDIMVSDFEKQFNQESRQYLVLMSDLQN